jgi:Asp-tRNA(Asn)/Glu-tRNA(Gln) amidotransferase A subunit family amidase
VEPAAAAELAAYEEATTRTPDFFFDILAWELRWPLRALNDERPGLISDGILGHLRKAEQMSAADYQRALTARDRLRELHGALAGRLDGFVTLAHIGAGQRGLPAVGTPWYNDASSAVGAPTFNLPVLSVEDLPLGIQLMGFAGGDENLTAHARWLLEALGIQHRALDRLLLARVPIHDLPTRGYPHRLALADIGQRALKVPRPIRMSHQKRVQCET